MQISGNGDEIVCKMCFLELARAREPIELLELIDIANKHVGEYPECETVRPTPTLPVRTPRTVPAPPEPPRRPDLPIQDGENRD